MSQTDLSTETATYQRLAPDVLEANKGRWVVIEGEEVLGFYAEFADAVRTVEQDLGIRPVMIHQITDDVPFFPFVMPAE